ncbi:unnamed protein product [Aureobasidium pullulans]|nr:unnamed protein product [Aureobasidium pullulans]
MHHVRYLRLRSSVHGFLTNSNSLNRNLLLKLKTMLRKLLSKFLSRFLSRPSTNSSNLNSTTPLTSTVNSCLVIKVRRRLTSRPRVRSPRPKKRSQMLKRASRKRLSDCEL